MPWPCPLESWATGWPVASLAGESLGLEWSTVANSLYVSGLAAIAAVVAALPVAILTIQYASRVSALLERITYVGFALPGIVIALALVFFGLTMLRLYIRPWACLSSPT